MSEYYHREPSPTEIKTVVLRTEDAWPAAFEYAGGDRPAIGKLVAEAVNLRAIVQSFIPERLAGATLTIGGTDFTCPAFRTLAIERIHRIYLYFLTIGPLEFEADGALSMADRMCADVWANGLLESGRRLLRKQIRQELEDSGIDCTIAGTYGPGYRGMALDSMLNFSRLIDGRPIGLSLNEYGVMNPEKSTAGIYIALTGEPDASVAEQADECVHCRGNREHCVLCANNRDHCGLAFDLGAATITAHLWDRRNEKKLFTLSRANPLARGGPMMPEPAERRERHHREIVNCVSDMVITLAERKQISPTAIDRMIIAGVPTMNQLFVGGEQERTTEGSQIPASLRPVTMTGRSAGLPINAGGVVRLPPNLSWQIGSDALMVMLADGMQKGSPDQPGVRLAVNIGTSTDLLLAGRGRLLACSAAAGPAFEGGGIRCGMRALPGAIQAVKIAPGAAGQPDSITLSLVGKSDPSGLCGAGLVSAVAELLRIGRLLPDGSLPDGDYILHRSERIALAVAQEDIRQLQQAKAAVAAGIRFLLYTVGASPADILDISLAGPCGAVPEASDAKAIGLLPDAPVRLIGHAAGTGASMVLLNDHHWQTALELAEAVEALEAAQSPVYRDYLNAAVAFPNPRPGH